MPYKLTYQVQIEFVGAGAGPMAALNPTGGALPGGGGTGQLKGFVTNMAVQPIVQGAGAGSALAAGDITTLLTALTNDLSTQMNAAIATMQGWPTGNP